MTYKKRTPDRPIQQVPLGTAFALFISLTPSLSMAEETQPSEGMTVEQVESASTAVLENSFLATESAETDLVVSKVRINNDGWSHARYRQTYAGLPVFEGETIVHFRPNGSLATQTDSLKRYVDLDATPTLTAEEAIDLAVYADGPEAQYSLPPEAQLMVFARGEAPALAYRVQLYEMSETRQAIPIFFIDAHSGETLLQYDNLQGGTGNGHHYSGVSFTTYSYGGSYYLQDNARAICTLDMNFTTFSTYTNINDSNDSWVATVGDQPPGVDVHWSAAYAYDYFLNEHGWDGWDDAGGPQTYTGVNSIDCMRVGVRYGFNGGANANWDPIAKAVKFGNGNASYEPFTYADVVGHEWTHGVSHYAVDFTYTGETGAINESWSDVFGEMVEDYATGSNDWLVADGIIKAGNAPVRYMEAPNTNGHYDHVSEVTSIESHAMAGIPNRVFTLLALGGTHSNGGSSVTGIGVDDAVSIWWLALTDYMTSGTTFASARVATLNAATQLFGGSSTEYNTVNTAWSRVGVTELPGDIVTYAGQGGTSGDTGDTGQATSALLNTPFGIGTGPDGSIYIADGYEHRVRKVTLGGVITAFAGTGTAGYSGDGAAATSAKLWYPWSVAVGSDGVVYIADATNHRIRKVTTGGTISTIIGTGTGGYNGEDDGTVSQVNYPRHLFVTPDNETLYFADTGNNRVRAYDISLGETSLVAGSGTAGFSGDGSAATSANLDSPHGVVATSSYVYIADSDNHRIRRVSLSSGNISTYAGTGSTGGTGNGGAASSATFTNPIHLALFEMEYDDSTEEHLLYVADSNSDAVRKIDLTNNYIYAFAGTGTGGFSGDGGAATSAQLDYVPGVGVDVIGNVFIADANNHAIRKVFK